MPTLALVSRMTDSQRATVQKLLGPGWDLRDFSADRDGLAQRGGAAEIVWGRVKREELPHLPKLRWVHATWTGVENMLYPELAARQVVLTNTRGQNAHSMAEHAVAALLYLARDFPAFARASAARQWQVAAQPIKLAGTRALILGVGAIAAVLVPKLAALGVAVRGVNTSGRPAHGVNDMLTLAAWRADLPKLLGDVQWLISLMPATAHTRHCIDAAVLRSLPAGAGVVNLSRGAVLDDLALVTALDSGHLRGAVLDVTDPEPPPESSPLFAHPKVLLTGHQSPRPFDETGVAFAIFEHNLACYLQGDLASFRNRVDYEMGY